MRFIREDIHDDINPLPSPILHSFPLLCLEACIPGTELGAEGSIKNQVIELPALLQLPARLERPYHACLSSRHKYLVVQVTLRALAAPSKDTELQFQESRSSFRVLSSTVRYSFTFTGENRPYP